MKAYTSDQFRAVFQSPFDKNEWSNILQHIFLAKKLRVEPEKIESDTSLNDGYYLGEFETSDFFKIGLFYYEIQQGSVANKRVGLRNLVKPFLRYEYDVALVVFDSGDHWRVSLICDIKDKATSPKRYTFVFGNRGLRYRTAISRFEFIQNKEVSFENIKKAFSVEALSDEFFNKYREQYADYVQYVTGKRIVKSGGKWVEQKLSDPDDAMMKAFGYDEKKVRDYIKKMMGRITFLHFLQSKGWMCGDYNYMQNMFEHSAYQDNYLDAVLEPLFFGVLNTKPAEREALFSKEKWDMNLLREWSDIPYLNGGLFEQDTEDEPDTVFPKEYFCKLFNFFSEYNFTIDENDPNDAEVGVDPEMLSKIFESLLEDNKDKGAFYTPKEIVRYMCQESLIAYLETNTSIASDKIRSFVLSPEDGVVDIPETKKSKLLDALCNVKICDPAIGSGAFPMGLLNELLHCREVLSYERFNRAEIKKSIIQNNIYGVDIEKGAVDIARLRFWLSIVVEEETPSPLPNLDYKIMQGNSLIESFEGVDLSKLVKKQIPNKNVDAIQTSILDEEIDIHQNRLSLLLSEYFTCYDHDRKVQLQNQISKSINAQLDANKINSITLSKLKTINIAANNQFFLWHTWFADVFAKGGFDIVIGNPPYIGEKGHKEIFQPVKNDIYLGQYYLGKMDYFYFFFHLAFNMLSFNGIGTFITTNYYPTALGARKLRADIKERMNINTLFNLGELRLFENAPGQHNMISLFSKGSDKCECKIIDVHKKGALNPLMFASIINDADEDTVYAKISQEDLFDGEENYIRIQAKEGDNTNNTISAILYKIEQNNKRLSEISIVNQGIVSGADKVTNKHLEHYAINAHKDDGIFTLSKCNYSDFATISKIQQSTEFDILKPFYKNSDIFRYSTNCNIEKYILFLGKNIKNELTLELNYPIVYRHLLPFKQIMVEKRLSLNEKLEQWFTLNRGTSHPEIFISPKIVCPQRSKINTFGYNECDWYATSDVFYITNPENKYKIKYILGVLNSKLYYIWLYNRGKRKGEVLELTAKPLSEIPIKLVSLDVQNEIIKIVDEIIDLKKKNSQSDTSNLEKQIDKIVYRIYGLTDEEIKIVENVI